MCIIIVVTGKRLKHQSILLDGCVILDFHTAFLLHIYPMIAYNVNKVIVIIIIDSLIDDS